VIQGPSTGLAGEYPDGLLIEAARDLMESARFCGLATTGEGGEMFVRTMDPFPPDAEMVVRLGTNTNTRKVNQIRSDPRVVLYYFDREALGYVVISGTAKLIYDPHIKSKWWKTEWAEFYDDDHRGDDYILIEVEPDRIEVVSPKHGIAAAPKEWKPATLHLQRREGP
jgi:general stress protein 26